MRLAVFFLFTVNSYALPLAALGGPEECQEAIEGYNAAVDEIDYRLKKYVGCLSESQGQDDCYTEFRRLKSAQSDFESAVSDYQSECE